MERSKVYFTNFRTQAFGDGLPTKLKKMIKKAGIGDIDMNGKFVAIRDAFWRTWKYQLSSSELCKSSCRCGKRTRWKTVFD